MKENTSLSKVGKFKGLTFEKVERNKQSIKSGGKPACSFRLQKESKIPYCLINQAAENVLNQLCKDFTNVDFYSSGSNVFAVKPYRNTKQKTKRTFSAGSISNVMDIEIGTDIELEIYDGMLVGEIE